MLLYLDNVVRRSFGARAGASRGGPVRPATAQRALAALQRSRNDADLLGNNSALRFRTYFNSSAAFLTGGEVSAVVVFREWLELTGTASYTRGQNLECGELTYLIPPLTGWTSLRAMPNKCGAIWKLGWPCRKTV